MKGHEKSQMPILNLSQIEIPCWPARTGLIMRGYCCGNANIQKKTRI
jgi:hypothetical protein